MAQLTVRQAAQQVGISRQTMFAKIKAGKVSATTDHNGQLQIDTSELLRVFGTLQTPTDSGTTPPNRPGPAAKTPDTPATVAQQIEIERLRAQLELKTAELAMTRERLDEAKVREQAAKDERDKLFGILEQQTRLLAAPPAPTPAPKATPTKRKANGKKATKKAEKKNEPPPEPEPQPATRGGFMWPFWGR
jgi:transcriptional regulator of acetoin/glycerol metabolism